MLLIQKEHTKIGRNVQWAKLAAAADELLHHLRDWISVDGGKSFISNSNFIKKGTHRASAFWVFSLHLIGTIPPPRTDLKEKKN